MSQIKKRQYKIFNLFHTSLDNPKKLESIRSPLAKELDSISVSKENFSPATNRQPDLLSLKQAYEHQMHRQMNLLLQNDAWPDSAKKQLTGNFAGQGSFGP